jgi:hypothetical protein
MVGRRIESEDETPIARDAVAAWDKLVRNLLSHKVNAPDVTPLRFRLDEDAVAHRRVFHNAVEARCLTDLAPHAGLVSKWTTKTAKLAALFALVELCTQTQLHKLLEGADKAREFLEVTGEHWLAAEEVMAWMLRSTIGVRDLSHQLEEESDAAVCMGWLKSRPAGEWFYPRDFVRALHRTIHNAARARSALEVLLERGLVERASGRNKGTWQFRIRTTVPPS